MVGVSVVLVRTSRLLRAGGQLFSGWYVGAPLWSVRFCGMFVACARRPRASATYLFKPSIQNFARRFRFGGSLRRKKVLGVLARRLRAALSGFGTFRDSFPAQNGRSRLCTTKFFFAVFSLLLFGLWTDFRIEGRLLCGKLSSFRRCPFYFS